MPQNEAFERSCRRLHGQKARGAYRGARPKGESLSTVTTLHSLHDEHRRPRRPKAGLEVGDEVSRVLEADREADQAVADPRPQTSVEWHAGVGHRRRVLSQRLDASQALGAREDAESLEQGPAFGHAALDLEAYHS